MPEVGRPVFNHERQIVALKLTSSNVNDTTPVPDLTHDLIGKLFGDKGYVGKDLAQGLRDARSSD